MIPKPMRNAKSLLIASIVSTSMLGQAAHCDTTGQVIEDGGGNVFMEEVVNEKQQQKEEAERKRIRRINRRLLSPKELRNVGIQMAPSGKLVPIINRNPNAPLIKQNVSKLTTEVQPGTNYPWAYPAMYNPYARYPYLPQTGINPYNRRLFNPGLNVPYNRIPALLGPRGLYNPGFFNPYRGAGVIPYGMASPYYRRPMIGLGTGLMGLGSRTTVTYGGGASPNISQEITMPPGGLGGGTFLNSFRSGNVPSGHRMSGSFFNPFTGSSSSFDSTVKPVTPHFN